MRVQAAGVWKQVVSGERRPIQICREYNLANSLLVRWRHEYEVRGEAAFTPRVPGGLDELNETEALKARVEELERFCGQLAPENSTLKKPPFSGSTNRGTTHLDRSLDCSSSPSKPPFASHQALFGPGCQSLPVLRKTDTRRVRRARVGCRTASSPSGCRRGAGSGTSRLRLPTHYQRITKALIRTGWVVNHKRVLRIMREESLLCQLKRRFRPATDSNHL
jgi:transposase